MKYGFIWFLHLDKPIQLARIAIIPCFIWGFFATIRSIFFVIAWGLFAVSLLITLCTFFMHIPSTEKVEKFISECKKDFVEKQKTNFYKYKKVEILELNGFAANKGIRFSRRIGKRKIFDTLVMLAWVQCDDEVWLAYEERTLWGEFPADRRCYQIHNPSDVQIRKITTHDEEMKWSLQVEEDKFLVSCKDDYHFRDFVNKYNVTVIE